LIVWNERVQPSDINNKTRFFVHNRKEVAQILGDLVRCRTELIASCHHTGKNIITTVINVDQLQGFVYLDQGYDEITSRGILDSDKIIFSTSVGLRVQWTSPKLSSVRLPDGPAFKIALPSDLIRVQRREYYRLMTPMVNPVLCGFALGADTCEFPLVDISSGGISVMATESDDWELVEGTEFQNCKFDLPEIGTTNLNLRVKWIGRIATKNGAIKHRLGLEYMDPSRGNQAMIQRYMVKLERESVVTR